MSSLWLSEGCSLVLNNLKVFTFNNFRVIINWKEVALCTLFIFIRTNKGINRSDHEGAACHDNKIAGSNLINSTTISNCWASKNPCWPTYIKHLDARFGSYTFDRICLWLGWWGALSLPHHCQKDAKTPKREIEKAVIARFEGKRDKRWRIVPSAAIERCESSILHQGRNLESDLNALWQSWSKLGMKRALAKRN